MKQIRKQKYLILLGIAAILMVGGIALFCTCAEAAVVSETAIQSVPCHSCCPELVNGPSHCDAIQVEPFEGPAVSQLSFRLIQPESKTVSSALSIQGDLPNNLSANFQPTTNPPLFSAEPIYLSLRVLRI
jgi:uncharacterized membrane protein